MDLVLKLVLLSFPVLNMKLSLENLVAFSLEIVALGLLLHGIELTLYTEVPFRFGLDNES